MPGAIETADAVEPAIGLHGITKRYPGGTLANRDVSLTVERGSIHGLLGENGAGKSTLMKVLFGLVTADAGEITVHGCRATLRTPQHAIAHGVGMVHQHFSLIPVFTVAENLVLGDEPTRAGRRLDLRAAEARISELSDRYGLRVDPRRRVAELSVAARQRVEILKALFRGATILVLDEPTAVLTPQDAQELHDVMGELRRGGTTIVFISHKLPEVVELCDRVSVLRDGALVGNREIEAVERMPGPRRAALERELALLMVGRELPPAPPRRGAPGAPVLRLRAATDGQRLQPLDLEVRGGEILGVAGVEGNGQSELVDLVVGVRRCARGRIELDGADVTGLSVSERLQRGLAHVAEDRHAASLVMAMDVADNCVLGFETRQPVARGPLWLSPRRARGFAGDIIRRFDVRTPSVRAPVATLSGGNQQRLVVGRELARRPRLVIAAQPTRGLDVAAAGFVHHELSRLRAEGCAVLLVSLDLAEVTRLADRVVVLSAGTVVGTALVDEIDEATLGLWMTGGARPAAGALRAGAR